ncbi:hypothetical protein A2917_03315 [Candidatus Nomurabacteria bacterium RIFCSPLOWO2_01_FULL_42_17]|uniref:Uncharacterized protein n=1 Tax=Candidatus Nomurabacteria bacterium RIFCSPLOWO2_01_FULL_42_17 TaxID=1801780 RepID=A0A1F6XN49_9BACT|nr:MAG: hypothetical protein A2917_03315 [Candidatus Nomurabacteria bacterium RIFCSPLOWO2_01_FULL_42_17]
MEPEKKSNGSLVGLVVIIIILIIGGIYIWMSNPKGAEQTPSENLTHEDSETLDSLELEAESTDSNTGVDANTVN